MRPKLSSVDGEDAFPNAFANAFANVLSFYKFDKNLNLYYHINRRFYNQFYVNIKILFKFKDSFSKSITIYNVY